MNLMHEHGYENLICNHTYQNIMFDHRYVNFVHGCRVCNPCCVFQEAQGVWESGARRLGSGVPGAEGGCAGGGDRQLHAFFNLRSERK